jgi:hypothetical protein
MVPRGNLKWEMSGRFITCKYERNDKRDMNFSNLFNEITCYMGHVCTGGSRVIGKY